MTISASSANPSPDHRSGLAAFQRASDADRERICDQLAVHYAAGRLGLDELDVRLYAAIRAETLIDLRLLVNDLAVRQCPRPASPPAPTQSGPPDWRPLDVLALLVMIGALGIGLVMLVGLAVFGVGGVALAGFAGGTTAAVGGASVAHLIHRSVDAGRQARAVTPAEPVAPTPAR